MEEFVLLTRDYPGFNKLNPELIQKNIEEILQMNPVGITGPVTYRALKNPVTGIFTDKVDEAYIFRTKKLVNKYNKSIVDRTTLVVPKAKLETYLTTYQFVVVFETGIKYINYNQDGERCF